MCGRFQLNYSIDKIIDNYSYIREVELISSMEKGEKFPSDEILIINQEFKATGAKWGFPLYGKLLINARAETLLNKDMFKDLVKNQRCIIPANYFYEWKNEKGKKIKHKVSLKGKEVFSMAGLYKKIKLVDGSEKLSVVIITTEPNREIRELHHRMPAILDKDKELLWLSKECSEEEALSVLSPYRDDGLSILQDIDFEQLSLI